MRQKKKRGGGGGREEGNEAGRNRIIDDARKMRKSTIRPRLSPTFNLLCVLDLFSERWQSSLFQILLLDLSNADLFLERCWWGTEIPGGGKGITYT